MDGPSACTPVRPSYVPDTASYIGELEHSDGTTQSIWVNISDVSNPDLSDVAGRATELFNHLIGQHNLNNHEIKSANREYVTYTNGSVTGKANHNELDDTERTWQAFERCVLGLAPTTSRRRPRREETFQSGHERPLSRASETSRRDSRRSSFSSPSHLETRRLTSSPELERMGSPKPGKLERHATSTFKPPGRKAVPTANLLGMARADRATDLALPRARSKRTAHDDLSSLLSPAQRPLSRASEEERESSPELPQVPVHYEGNRRHRVTVHTGPKKAVMTEAEVARKSELQRRLALGQQQRDSLVRGRNAVRSRSSTSHEDVREAPRTPADIETLTGPRRGVPLSDQARQLLEVK